MTTRQFVVPEGHGEDRRRPATSAPAGPSLFTPATARRTAPGSSCTPRRSRSPVDAQPQFATTNNTTIAVRPATRTQRTPSSRAARRCTRGRSCTRRTRHTSAHRTRARASPEHSRGLTRATTEPAQLPSLCKARQPTREAPQRGASRPFGMGRFSAVLRRTEQSCASTTACFRSVPVRELAVRSRPRRQSPVGPSRSASQDRTSPPGRPDEPSRTSRRSLLAAEPDNGAVTGAFVLTSKVTPGRCGTGCWRRPWCSGRLAGGGPATARAPFPPFPASAAGASRTTRPRRTVTAMRYLVAVVIRTAPPQGDRRACTNSYGPHRRLHAGTCHQKE